jgi:hypothetical protein
MVARHYFLIVDHAWLRLNIDSELDDYDNGGNLQLLSLSQKKKMAARCTRSAVDATFSNPFTVAADHALALFPPAGVPCLVKDSKQLSSSAIDDPLALASATFSTPSKAASASTTNAPAIFKSRASFLHAFLHSNDGTLNGSVRHRFHDCCHLPDVENGSDDEVDDHGDGDGDADDRDNGINDHDDGNEEDDNKDDNKHGVLLSLQGKRDRRLRQCGPWIIDMDKEFGSGEYASVYATKHELYPDLRAATKVGNVDENEIAIAMYLGAAGVGPRVYDAWFCCGIGYLVMENISNGRTFHDIIIATDKKDVSEMPAPLLRRAQAAIDELTKHGVEHGDLHYDQLLVGPRGHIKVIDFGNDSSFIRRRLPRRHGLHHPSRDIASVGVGSRDGGSPNSGGSYLADNTGGWFRDMYDLYDIHTHDRDYYDGTKAEADASKTGLERKMAMIMRKLRGRGGRPHCVATLTKEAITDKKEERLRAPTGVNKLDPVVASADTRWPCLRKRRLSSVTATDGDTTKKKMCEPSA